MFLVFEELLSANYFEAKIPKKLKVYLYQLIKLMFNDLEGL